jgi:hypothetical protein
MKSRPSDIHRRYGGEADMVQTLSIRKNQIFQKCSDQVSCNDLLGISHGEQLRHIQDRVFLSFLTMSYSAQYSQPHIFMHIYIDLVSVFPDLWYHIGTISIVIQPHCAPNVHHCAQKLFPVGIAISSTYDPLFSSNIIHLPF